MILPRPSHTMAGVRVFSSASHPIKDGLPASQQLPIGVYLSSGNPLFTALHFLFLLLRYNYIVHYYFMI